MVALAAVGLGAANTGCEGGGPSEVMSYVDSAGRSCSVDLADISLTATCDAEPGVTCDAGQEAGFVLSDDFDFETEIYTRQSCPACINREAHETYIASGCANVQCTTDADCLNRDGDLYPFTCQSGSCYRTNP